jgi:hypothetical protein
MDHRVSKDMISKGMSVTGEKRTEDLGGSQYGSVATPGNLMDAYSSMYKAEEKVEEDAKYGYDSKGNSLNPKDKKKVKEEVEEKVEENDFVKELIESGKFSEEEIKRMSEAMEVTAADKKANTPAYKAYKEGKKNVKTGEPMYKAAPHLKGV